MGGVNYTSFSFHFVDKIVKFATYSDGYIAELYHVAG